MLVDATAQALLNEADSADGGTRGSTIKTCANNACYFNAVALGGFGASTPEVLTESVARVLYLLAVREVAGEFSDSQQAAIPWTAQAFGVKMRCFHPGGSMKDVEGGASFAGKWSKELIGPLNPSGVEPTIYLTMSITSHKHAFSSIHEFTETTRRWERGADGELHQMRWMPDFNHWVLMLPPANAGALQAFSRS
ncbi:unnamed protein product [Ectocarpus sp. CCAP 1310/34]|nr:unnamed protein product [Ectocarpus sp. CCAP 1310/34]